MELQDINHYKDIIRDSYSKPGEGILLSQMWYIIELYNEGYSTQQKNNALITIMKELLLKGLVKVNKAFSKGEEKPYWEKGHEEYIRSLEDFLSKVSLKDLERNDPEYTFIKFDYEFVDWQIDSPIDLKKYGLE